MLGQEKDNEEQQEEHKNNKIEFLSYGNENVETHTESVRWYILNI